MQKVLLWMPFFMNYENTLKTALEKQYQVQLVDCDQFDQLILDRYRQSSRIVRGFQHLVKPLQTLGLERVQDTTYEQSIAKIDASLNAYDIVFCINGAYTPDRAYEYIKEKNPSARTIFYAWDDLINLRKTRHLRFFEEQYSYNIEDCRRRNMHYLPVFVQEESKGHAKTDQYDITYIASAYSKERVDFADMLFAMYGKQYRLFIYLYDPQMSSRSQFAYCEPLSNSQYIDILRRSKAILDVPMATQQGPTTRAFDALLTKTKVITTNKHMKEYPIYSENILIIDKEKPVIDAKFMSKSYMQTDYQCMNVTEWIHALGL